MPNSVKELIPRDQIRTMRKDIKGLKNPVLLKKVEKAAVTNTKPPLVNLKAEPKPTEQVKPVAQTTPVQKINITPPPVVKENQQATNKPDTKVKINPGRTQEEPEKTAVQPEKPKLSARGQEDKRKKFIEEVEEWVSLNKKSDKN